MTGGIVDPGDPFEPGSVRFEARARVLRAVAAVLDEAAEDANEDVPARELPALDELREAHRRWVLFGRDGE